MGNNDDFSFLGLLRFFPKALLCFITQDVKFWKCCSLQINKRQILRLANSNRPSAQAGGLESRKVSIYLHLPRILWAERRSGLNMYSLLQTKKPALCKSGAIGWKVLSLCVNLYFVRQLLCENGTLFAVISKPYLTETDMNAF